MIVMIARSGLSRACEAASYISSSLRLRGGGKGGFVTTSWNQRFLNERLASVGDGVVQTLSSSSLLSSHHHPALYRCCWMMKHSTIKPFSSSATPASTAAAAAADTDPSKTNSTKIDNKIGNLFLDNLGTIFLSAIGLIIASLVRSYYGTKNRNLLRDLLEEQASLDPAEIDDLRTANSELNVEVFRTIVQTVQNHLALHSNNNESSSSSSSTETTTTTSTTATMTYDEFAHVVRRTMKELKGEAFTVELGHLVDRVVLGAMQRNNSSSSDRIPVTFWFTVLSLALHSSVPERIQILYQVLQQQQSNNNNGGVVTIEQVEEMVGYLQDTCQLVPDCQIVPIKNRKYPVQQFERGTASQLIEGWRESKAASAATDSASSLSTEEAIDVDAFAAILRSKSVCAWGECYHKKRYV